MVFTPRGGDPLKYVLGRGKLYFKGDVKRAGVTPTNDAWRDLGNCTAFTVAQESEVKEHKSFLSGIATIDKQVPVSQKMTVSFTTDEVANWLNLAAFFSGTLTNDALAAAGVVATPNPVGFASDLFAGTENFFVQTAATDQVYDLWYDIELFIPAAGSILAGTYRAIDFSASGLQTITVRKATSTRTAADGTLLTENTHYLLDRKMGRIMFLNVGGGIARGDNFQVKWAASPDATKALGIDTQQNLVAILTNSGITGSLKFVQENPNNADLQTEYGFWKIQLKPEGEFSGISDDWAGLGFSGAVEAISNPPVGTSAYGWVRGRDAYAT